MDRFDPTRAPAHTRCRIGFYVALNKASCMDPRFKSLKGATIGRQTCPAQALTYRGTCIRLHAMEGA